MTHSDAIKLAAKLTRNARIPFCAEVVNDRIVFTGCNKSHSLDVACSDEARILAHWEGYTGPLADDKLTFGFGA